MEIPNVHEARERAEVVALIEEVRSALAALGESLPEAIGCQWQASPTTRLIDDTSERAASLVSDPTYATVTDEARLEVRESVSHSVRILKATRAALTAARSRVLDAVGNWEGRR